MKRLTDTQINTLYVTLKDSIDPRDILIQLCLETGCRVSESVILTPDHLSGDSLRIDPLKNSEPRQVTISPNLANKLARFQGSYGREVSESNRRNSQRKALTRRFQALCLKILGDSFGIHSLRHTAFARLYERTQDILLVQQWAGHRSINSTLEYLKEDRKRRASEAMREIIG